MQYFRLITILGLVFFFSCKEETNKEKSRNFRPVDISVAMSEGKVIVSWSPVKESVSYTVQLSSNSDFTSLLTTETLQVTECFFSGLEGNKTYYVRIRSDNSDFNCNSAWQTTSFDVDEENLLLMPEDERIGCDSVEIRWMISGTVDKLLLVYDGNKELTVELTATEQEKGIKVIKELRALTEYTVSIFNGTQKRGSIIFQTKECLSKLDVKVTTVSDLKTVIENSKDGSIIHFSSGVYAFGNQHIILEGKSVVFQSDPDDEMPEVYVRSFQLKGNVGNLIFRNLSLSGFAFGGTSPNELNSYFIDLTTEFESVDTILIEGCTIHHIKNCVIRGNRGTGEQKAGYIGFKNCIVHNVNKEGVNSYENFKLDRLEVKTVEFINCTFYDMGHGLISNREVTLEGQKVNIINCTFDNFGSTDSVPNKYLFDFSDGSGIYTFKNNIFSNTKCYNSESGNHSKGFLFGSTGKGYSCNNLFYNFPLSAEEVAEWTENNNSYENIDPDYADRLVGDFTLGNDFLKTAGEGGTSLGDSRWIK